MSFIVVTAKLKIKILLLLLHTTYHPFEYKVYICSEHLSNLLLKRQCKEPSTKSTRRDGCASNSQKLMY